MPLSARLLLAATAICCFATLMAFPMDGLVTGQRCRCLTTTNQQVRGFSRIEIVPSGAHCRNTEILLTLKNNQTVCVDPDAEWIKKIIVKAMQKRKST